MEEVGIWEAGYLGSCFVSVNNTTSFDHRRIMAHSYLGHHFELIIDFGAFRTRCSLRNGWELLSFTGAYMCQALYSYVIYICALTGAHGGYRSKLQTSSHIFEVLQDLVGPSPP